VIFQPRRRRVAAAGREMVRRWHDGPLGIQEVYACTDWPVIPAGQFSIRPGRVLCRPPICSRSRSKVWAGHAAKPGNETIDTGVGPRISSLRWQTIAAGMPDPVGKFVVVHYLD